MPHGPSKAVNAPPRIVTVSGVMEDLQQLLREGQLTAQLKVTGLSYPIVVPVTDLIAHLRGRNSTLAFEARLDLEQDIRFALDVALADERVRQVLASLSATLGTALIDALAPRQQEEK